ncbi:prepilin peptidase, partial [Candidatus Woesearchaeota archaeon]
MIIADILLITVAIIALIFASLVDLRIKEVPDWLNFSLIIVALGIRLIHAIVYSEWQYFYYGLLGLGSMFLLGMSLFYTKQWGGGDTKLLIALGTVFATRPYFIKPGINLPFIFIIVVNLMIIGALYSIVWS